jgi:hypothetical protein
MSRVHYQVGVAKPRRNLLAQNAFQIMKRAGSIKTGDLLAQRYPQRRMHQDGQDDHS